MPRGITQADVFGAADALLARGERPTIERIRRELGRGSPNTVNPLLDTWWRSLSERLAGTGSEERLPNALNEPLQALYEQLRKAATEEGRAALAEQREALEVREVELEEQTRALESERTGLTQALATLKEEVRAQRASNQALKQAEKELRALLASAQAESRHLAERLAKTETARERLIQAHERERTRLGTQAETQEQRWLLEIDRLRQEIKQQHSDTAKSARAAREQQADLKKLLSKAQANEQTLRRDHKTLRAQLTREQEGRVRAEAKAAAGQELIQALRATTRVARTAKAPTTKRKRKRTTISSSKPTSTKTRSSSKRTSVKHAKGNGG
ncbi:MAG: DNA-binding protein [Terriglobia bacterium]